MSGYVMPYLLSKLFQLHFHLPLWHRCINVINTALFSLFFLTSFFSTWKFQIYWNNRNQFNRFDSFCDFAYLYTFFASSVHCSVLFLFQFCQLIYSFNNLFICLSLHFMIFFNYLFIDISDIWISWKLDRNSWNGFQGKRLQTYVLGSPCMDTGAKVRTFYMCFVDW